MGLHWSHYHAQSSFTGRWLRKCGLSEYMITTPKGGCWDLFMATTLHHAFSCTDLVFYIDLCSSSLVSKTSLSKKKLRRGRVAKQTISFFATLNFWVATGIYSLPVTLFTQNSHPQTWPCWILVACLVLWPKHSFVLSEPLVIMPFFRPRLLSPFIVTMGQWVQEILEWITWVLCIFLPAVIVLRQPWWWFFFSFIDPWTQKVQEIFAIFHCKSVPFLGTKTFIPPRPMVVGTGSTKSLNR